MTGKRELYDEATFSNAHYNSQHVLPGMHTYRIQIENTQYQDTEEQDTSRTSEGLGQLFGLF